MNDTSIAFSGASEAETGLLSDVGSKPFAKSHGYCAECGTWDAHGKRCLYCGYDFHDEPVDNRSQV